VTCGRRRRWRSSLTTWQRPVRLMAVWKHISVLNGWHGTKRNGGGSWPISTVPETILEVPPPSPHSVASLLATRLRRRWGMERTEVAVEAAAIRNIHHHLVCRGCAPPGPPDYGLQPHLLQVHTLPTVITIWVVLRRQLSYNFMILFSSEFKEVLVISS
jgi:hypothetical protein